VADLSCDWLLQSSLQNWSVNGNPAMFLLPEAEICFGKSVEFQHILLRLIKNDFLFLVYCCIATLFTLPSYYNCRLSQIDKIDAIQISKHFCHSGIF
jgi:hypothetical protein